jgi:hypothetical protein
MIKQLRASRAALVGLCCALLGAAAVPVVGLAGSITGSTGDGPMVLQSGATTLAYQAGSNISSIPSTSYTGMWTRVGDTVHMTGVIPANPTTTGASTTVYIPLPVDSNINGASNCEGNGIVSWPGATTARVIGSSAVGHTHQCVVDWAPTTTSTQYVFYSLSYRVID